MVLSCPITSVVLLLFGTGCAALCASMLDKCHISTIVIIIIVVVVIRHYVVMLLYVVLLFL